MNRSKFGIVGLALAAMTGTALAQDPPADGTTTTDPAATDPAAAPATTSDPAMEPAPAAVGGKVIGVDVLAVLPLGDYSDAADFGLGAALRFEYGLKPAIAITARAGLIYNLAKDPIDTFLLVPIHVGGKYSVGTSGLFIQGELGITHARLSAGDLDDNNTKFSFEAGAGYQKGKISARAGFYYVATENALQGIMASVGYDFAAL